MNPPDVDFTKDCYERIAAAVREVVMGQDEALRLVFATLACPGHSLIEGVPGLAKTLLVRCLASALGIRFGRVQFTPDLMPSDITGTPILQPSSGRVEFRPGPIFTDLLLADEINRASAKTQAALLEAMQEGAVTVDGQRHDLGPDFCVFATQNPVEHEGTYALPEAELDRFLFKIVVGYPDERDEHAILANHHAGVRVGVASPVLTSVDLARCRAVVRDIIVREEIVVYTAALVRATRNDASFALGASPRAGVFLLRAAKCSAAMAGRDFVLPEDVQEMVLPVLQHRVQLQASAEIEGLSAGRALQATMASVTVPR
jgi:MoxR-like ATPase